MKYLLVSFFVLCQGFGFAQDEPDSIYFPQEQLIHPDCKDSDDQQACLQNQVEKNVKSLIDKAIVQKSIIKDTLRISVSFEVDKNGDLIKGRDWTSVNDSVLRKELKEELKSITQKLPRFEVLNKKPKSYVSKHMLSFKYITSEDSNILKLTRLEELDRKYEGGVIEEVPLYPGCKRGNEKKARECFQKSMQRHITKNFRYPEEAQAKGLQGKVAIMFFIDKNGNTTNRKVRGPHQILEEEALRIVALLPKFEPGLQNGKPVRVPYSIPITFRLQ